MKFCFILPPEYADIIEGWHLILAQETYKVRPKGYVIMDNGAAELGSSLELSELKKAYLSYYPDEVVLPDAIGNYRETIKRSYEAISEFKAKLMAVPQGANAEEWWECFKMLCQFVHVVGISKYAPIDRFEAARKIDMPVHLLGIRNNESIDNYIDVSIPNIRSIDSSYPVRCTYANIRLREVEKKPKLGELPKRGIIDKELLLDNLKYINEVFK